MDDEIDAAPEPLGFRKDRVDRRAVRDVAMAEDMRIQLGGQRAHPLLQRLALIAERDFGAGRANRLGDSPGDGAIVRDAENDALEAFHRACLVRFAHARSVDKPLAIPGGLLPRPLRLPPLAPAPRQGKARRGRSCHKICAYAHNSSWTSGESGLSFFNDLLRKWVISVGAPGEGNDEAAALRRFGLALVRDDRWIVDDVAAERLVEKLIRQTKVALIEDGRGREEAFSRFVELYRRHVRRLAAEDAESAWGEINFRGPIEVTMAVRTLPLELRESLLLVVLGGFSHGAAARALNIPLAMLLDRLKRARERLASQLDSSTRISEGDGGRPSHLRLVK